MCNFSYQFPMTSTTITLVIVDQDNNKVLLGKRASNAQMFPDWWSLPGGFLDAKTSTTPGEITEQTCAREMMEETNINITNLHRFKLFGSNSDPNEDPRAHVVNLWYYIAITAEEAAQAKAGDDISELMWCSFNGPDMKNIPDLAFNHKTILYDGLNINFKLAAGKFKQYPGDDRIGLMVCRIQPLHLGHTRLINKMIEDYSTVIIGVGSSDKEVSLHNPWTFEQRKSMLRQVYGSRIKIIQLADLGAEENSNSWCDYVLEKIEKLKLPKPTDYFTGSKADSTWYKGRFGDRVHIMERTESNFISGTDIRRLIQTGNDDWKNYVPRVNHRMIEETFPDNLKIS